MPKLNTLFINADSNRPHCSFYESGIASFDALKKHSEILNIKYSCFHNVTDSDPKYNNIKFDDESVLEGIFDLVIFNYNHVTMRYFPSSAVYNIDIPKIMLSWEINPLIDPWNTTCYFGDPHQVFNAMAVPNPILNTNDDRIIKLPRIVPRSILQRHLPMQQEPVIISTYGLPSPNKDLEGMVSAVNKEFDNAIIRFHFPDASWNPPDINSYQKNIFKTCKSLAKPGITVIESSNYMTEAELIKWLAESDLLMFFYKKERDEAAYGSMPSATDQAISARVPMALTDSICTQHITPYTGSYPNLSLREIIDRGNSPIQKIYDDWSPKNFASAFDSYIKEAF